MATDCYRNKQKVCFYIIHLQLLHQYNNNNNNGRNGSFFNVAGYLIEEGADGL